MEEEIIFTQHEASSGNVAEILLNRPKALNALSSAMCIALKEQLDNWAQDEKIKAVIIKGAGSRAFCAGGDVRQLFIDKSLPSDLRDTFFYKEYLMNRTLFHFPKPYISFLNGITMGGGAGVSIHGDFRVATENLVFAMPETMIGFYPDIGAGHFLTRLPGKMGWYLGLTGEHVHAQDAYELGLATHLVPSIELAALEGALLLEKIDTHQEVKHVLDRFHQPLGENKLIQYQAEIDDCFMHNSIEEIEHALKEQQSEFADKTLQALKLRSPTSLKVTLEFLNRAQDMQFDEIISMDFNVAIHFLRNHDFFEGVRAALIDKDQSPNWQPMSLKHVTKERVAEYFNDTGITFAS